MICISPLASHSTLSTFFPQNTSIAYGRVGLAFCLMSAWRYLGSVHAFFGPREDCPMYYVKITNIGD